MEISTIVISVVGAVVFSLLTYLRKRAQTGEEFDVIKMGVTAVFGLLVGVIMLLTGMEPTEDNIVYALGLYGGLAIALENLVRGVLAGLTQKPE